MAGYVPNYQKKNRIFAKREQELLHAIKHGGSRQTLLKLAEKLRTAKIAVFKSRFAETTLMEPHKFDPHDIALHNGQVQRWISMAADEIVDLYCSGSKLEQAAKNPVATSSLLAGAKRSLAMDDPGIQPNASSGRWHFSYRTLFVLFAAVAVLLSLLSACKWSPAAVAMIAGLALWVAAPYLDRHLSTRSRTLVGWMFIVIVILGVMLGLLIPQVR